MKRWLKAILAGAALLAPVAGFAGIDNTHHDMSILLPATGQKCAYCHSVTTATSNAAFGSVGSFCVSVCHINAGTVYGASPQVLPTSAGVYNGVRGTYTVACATASQNILSLTGAGHAALAANLPGVGDLQANIGATGWPHSSETSIQCTTCHSVHDAVNPPFLNAPLATGNATTAFCARCHKGDAAIFAGTTGRLSNGAHPTEIVYPVANTAKRSFYLTNATAPTPMFVQATVVGTFNAFTSHWNTGGHVMSNAASGLPSALGNAAALVGCYSCHAVHTEAATPNAGRGTSLLVTNNFKDVCNPCHGNGAYTFGAGGTQENPGVTNQYHPVNTEAPTSSLNVEAGLSAEYTALATPLIRPAIGNSSPYCFSCHDMHGSRVGNMAQRIIRASASTFCGECHNAIPGHHPVGNMNYATVAFGNFSATTAWGASLTDGLQCEDCHGAASAHNW